MIYTAQHWTRWFAKWAVRLISVHSLIVVDRSVTRHDEMWRYFVPSFHDAELERRSETTAPASGVQWKVELDAVVAQHAGPALWTLYVPAAIRTTMKADACGIRKEEGRALVYGIPSAQWKAEHQAEAITEQLVRMEASLAELCIDVALPS